jgi:hypothetical protein
MQRVASCLVQQKLKPPSPLQSSKSCIETGTAVMQHRADQGGSASTSGQHRDGSDGSDGWEEVRCQSCVL